MAELETYKGYYLWRYVPSLAAAVIFLILFLLATLFHSWKIWKTRTVFCIVFAIGGLFEVIGFGARASAHSRTGSVLTFSIQNVFILLGPTLFAATVYMTLGRIIRSIRAEQSSVVRVDWLTKIFVTGDVLSFLLQGTGAGIMATGSNASLGQDITMVGLVVQVVMFILFIITAIIFQVRMHRYPTRQAFDIDLPWKKHLYTLYAVSSLILVRSIFRVVEYAMGQDGYPLTHEWTLYIFDAVLMFGAMVIYGVFFPSELRVERPKSVESGGMALGGAEGV
ncbi:hypothetical protein SI65_10020 [Aspergillus cristatus]|uniref:Protein RTA1 n=1 Tax=Aspergillus cristatus TaxID=573508 RepID=A0A1E3B0T1_ASPCR|nr:hypothetical protein SI65_10020 [Aspergillus cristatus]